MPLNLNAFTGIHIHTFTAVHLRQFECSKTFDLYILLIGQGFFYQFEHASEQCIRTLLRHVVLFTQQSDKILQCYLFIHGNRNSYLNFSFRFVLGL